VGTCCVYHQLAWAWNVYFFLCCVYALVMVGRLMNVMEFHPDIGIVSRTLQRSLSPPPLLVSPSRWMYVAR
jgi:hypothetical protein